MRNAVTVTTLLRPDMYIGQTVRMVNGTYRVVSVVHDARRWPWQSGMNTSTTIGLRRVHEEVTP